MKKILLLSMLLIASITTLTSCSKDDNESSNNYPSIIGSWSETSDMPGEYISSVMEVIWTFNADNTSTQRVILKVNNATMRDVSNDFTYVYKGTTITIKGKESISEYEISVTGNKMKLGNKEAGYFDLTKK